MWSGRRKTQEQNKILHINNQISQIFTPVAGIIPEIAEIMTWLVNGEHIYNYNSGNVGIGKKTPQTSLDVNGVINASSDITINYVPIAPPIGSITAYTLATSPPGWFICDGSAVSRVLYPSLFATIGITFGRGDGDTTFNLPNYQGAFLRGAGTNGTYSGPEANTSQLHATQTHTHTANSVVTDPGHVHSQTTINDDFNNSGSYEANSNPSFAQQDGLGSITWNNIGSKTTGVTVNTTIGNTTDFVHANETRPYNFGVYWIIKY